MLHIPQNGISKCAYTYQNVSNGHVHKSELFLCFSSVHSPTSIFSTYLLIFHKKTWEVKWETQPPSSWLFSRAKCSSWSCLWLLQARETCFCTCVLAVLSECTRPSFVPKKSSLAIYLFFGDKHCVLLLHMAHATSAKEQLHYHTFTRIFHKNDWGQSVHCPGHLPLHGGLTVTFSVLVIF